MCSFRSLYILLEEKTYPGKAGERMSFLPIPLHPWERLKARPKGGVMPTVSGEGRPLVGVSVIGQKQGGKRWLLVCV